MNLSIQICSEQILFKKDDEYIISPGILEINGPYFTKVYQMKIDEYFSFLKYESHCKRRNFGRKLITPAFVNCHTHIAMNFFKALSNRNLYKKNIVEQLFFKAESLLLPSDVRAFARIGAYENLLNGNGFVWDHYYYGKEVAEACLEVGLSAAIAPTLQDLSGPGLNLSEQMFDETLTIHSQQKFSQNGIFAAFGPHATDTVSPRLWKEVFEASRHMNVPIHSHLAQSLEEFKRIQNLYQKTPTSFLKSIGVLEEDVSLLFAHGIYLKKNDFKDLQGLKKALVFCPFSQLIFQFPANIFLWEKNKLNWYLATDCVASNDSMNLQKEIRFVSGYPSLVNTFSYYQRYLDNDDKNAQNKFLDKRKKLKKQGEKFSNTNFLLDKVFDGPGSFHPLVKAGLIKKDSLANFIIWDEEHPSMWPCIEPAKNISLGDTTGAIYNMCVNGRWVSEDGYFIQGIVRSSSYQNALAEANDRLTLLLRRLL